MADNIEDLDLVPPKTAQDNAQKVLDWREERGDDVKGMTRTGWIRANQLADGEELSPNIVKRMAQFNRHRGNSGVSEEYEGEPWKDAGRVAWLGWGADAGVDWAMRMSERITSLENTGNDVVTTMGRNYDETTIENQNVINQIRSGTSSSNDESRAISKNTYNGYFQDVEFDDDNWEDAVNRLKELHGMARRFMTHVATHEAEGHGRPENVPAFEEPIDTETLDKFVENVDENVDEETFKNLVNNIKDLDEDIRSLFFDVIVHDDYMHEREGFDVEQLLSQEEMVKGEDYETMEGCVSFHVDEEDMDSDQAYAVCAGKFDLESYENKEGIQWEEGDMVRWQVEPGLFGEIVHVDDERNIVMVEILRPSEEGLSSTGYTISAAYSDITTMKGAELSQIEELSVILERNEDFDIILKPRELQEQGDLVRWDSSGGLAYGRVDTVERDGVVSAEPEGPDMEGTEDEPAYKVEVYDYDGEEWSGTEQFVVHRADSLTVIDGFPESRSNSSEELQKGILPSHEALGDYDTQNTGEWNRPDYSEFQESYGFEESFADLDVEDKRLVAAHFGRVDNTSYEDATYGDLQLPHHSPSTQNVDRAAVIAARQRLPQSDMSQDDMEAIDTHLADHLREDFEEDASPVIERENSDNEEFEGAMFENGELVSYDDSYGKGFGKVVDREKDIYEVELYSAKLGGGWEASGNRQTFSEEELSKEGNFPDSLNDVFEENKKMSAEAETVEENTDENKSAEEFETGTEELSQQLSPSEIQQVSKKVQTIAEVMGEARVEDYLNRSGMDYTVEEFKEILGSLN